MGSWHKSYTEVVANAEHYTAIGQTDIYLDEDDPNLPWDKVQAVEPGCGVRCGIPTGAVMLAYEKGLALKWSIDFEERGANGHSVSMFDRDRLRRVMKKLPQIARSALADLLTNAVLPEMSKRTAETALYFKKQSDSEHLVHELIAEARTIQR